MFDYEAGEKYKITLCMVAIAGMLAGMFFTMLLMPTPEPTRHKKGGGMSDRVLNNPDITGSRGGYGGVSPMARSGDGGNGAQSHPADPAVIVDRGQAQQFMERWLPRIWDLSAATASQNQEMAIKYMTPECADAYRHNIWTADLAKQVRDSGLHSSFVTDNLDISENLQDGSVVIKVRGTQTLGVPGKQGRTRDVNLEYMLKKDAHGMKIAGISEGKR